MEWVPFWFREVQLVGSICYGNEEWEGRVLTTFEVALELVREGNVDLESLVTHHFPIDRYEEALRVAGSKGSEEVIKAAFRYEP